MVIMAKTVKKRGRGNYGASVSQEDYLKAIWKMVQEEQEPISARLSERLGVTPPAVTAALKRLARNGMVKLGPRGRIRLTAKGRDLARHLVLRHRLAEKLLTDVLGMEWTHVHDEAEKLEHAISPAVEELLLKYFGRQSTCPHGNPLLGDSPRTRRAAKVHRLSDVDTGQRVEVRFVSEEGIEFLEYLDQQGLRPGTRFLVEHKDYDDTMHLALAGKTVHLGKTATDRIWVAPARR